MEQFDGYKVAAEIIVGPISTGSRKPDNNADARSQSEKNRAEPKQFHLRDSLTALSDFFIGVKSRIQSFLAKPVWKSVQHPDDRVSLGKAMFGACAISASLFTGMKFDDNSQCLEDQSSLEVGAVVCYVDSNVGAIDPNVVFRDTTAQRPANGAEVSIDQAPPSRSRDQLLLEGYGRAKKRSDDTLLACESSLLQEPAIFERTTLIDEGFSTFR